MVNEKVSVSQIEDRQRGHHVSMNRKSTRAVSMVIFLALGIALTGCQGVSRYDSMSRPTTTQLDIFRDGAKPTKAYKEIGMITDDGKLSEQLGIEAKFMKKAKAMGGNAVIFYPLVKTGTEMQPFFIGSADTYLYKATVVVYE